jgi:hypothetical protein
MAWLMRVLDRENVKNIDFAVRPECDMAAGRVNPGSNDHFPNECFPIVASGQG